MSVAAVLSPLLLIFGLKYGTIDTLRMRLVQDPRNREVRPMASQAFSHDWFAHLRQRPDVAFMVPMTRQIAATDHRFYTTQVRAGDLESGLHGGARSPTTWKAAPIPGDGECVLTHFAAEQLQAQVGDWLHVDGDTHQRREAMKPVRWSCVSAGFSRTRQRTEIAVCPAHRARGRRTIQGRAGCPGVPLVRLHANGLSTLRWLGCAPTPTLIAP